MRGAARSEEAGDIECCIFSFSIRQVFTRSTLEVGVTALEGKFIPCFGSESAG